MKKTLLLLSGSLFTYNSFAQQTVIKALDQTNNSAQLVPVGTDPSEKTTGLSDTLYYGTQAQFNGPFVNLNFDFAPPLDSGKFYGINVAGFKGFGQLYRYAGIDASAPQDTTYNILGFISRWHGTRQPNSQKNIVFSIWKRGNTKTAVANRNKFYVFGKPEATPTASRSIPLSGITPNNTNATITYLTTPLTGINYDVYVGYTIIYNWNSLAGDTVGLRSTQTSGPSSYNLETGTGDTLVHARNLIQDATNTWRSVAFDLGITNGGDQVIFPIIQLDCPNCSTTNIKGITKDNLTYFGHYPNPAISKINVKFELKKMSDVTIKTYDINGRLVHTTMERSLSSGGHVIELSTGNLSNGNYIYTIETSDGSSIASQFTISK